MITRRIRAGLQSAALLALWLPAHAHIVLAEPEAVAGSYYAAFFRVSHGCEASPTVRLRIEIPEGVTSAHPQPKPGWKVSVEKVALAKPIKTEGGEVRERVSALIWEGNLEAEHFDQFGAMLKLPANAGLLYFPAVQTCTHGENRWVQIPATGQAWGSLPRPAPVLNVTGGSEHAHH